MYRSFFFRLLPAAVAATGLLAACGTDGTRDAAGSGAASPDTRLRDSIKTVVVIYAENRGFDTLYGLFPGADGIPGVNPTAIGPLLPQTDRGLAGTVLPRLPKVWHGVTVAGQKVTIAEGRTANQPNRPFQIDAASGFQDTGVPVGQDVTTRDLYHRFFENQMQINGGRNDRFAAWANGGGLTMGYYDGSRMQLWKLAQQYVLADNFFMGAFGGSFLNHQYLVCACVPEYPNADTSAAAKSISVLETDGAGRMLPRLALASRSPASAIDGPPVYVNSSNLTPKNYAGDGTFRAVNTMQPAFQPSYNDPAPGGNPLLADPAKPSTLPRQTAATIGDMLDRKKVDWAWYAGAYNATLATAQGDRKFVMPRPGFQFHHQPFGYFAKFDPTQAAGAAYRAAHLKDFDAAFLQDAAAGRLPPVSFYKPQGNLNQHAGYANVADGDAHIAGVIAQLQASPQWKNMLIVVTYDENGGFWDHKAVPRGDIWGPGTRIPALIVSPWARRGVVDHTQYDTGSILRFITRRFQLDTLPGIAMRDAALAKNGLPPMGDLTAALDLSQAK
ncbi:MAG: acid phosphatase [Pseudomonadota bacterium]